MLSHLKGALGFPITQCLSGTDDSQTLVVAQLWCTHLQAYRLGVAGLCAHVPLASCYTVGKGRGVHKGVLRDVKPVVIDGVTRAFGGCKLQPVWHHKPLCAARLVTAHDTIIVVDVCAGLHGLAQFACPVVTVDGPHLVLFRFSFG